MVKRLTAHFISTAICLVVLGGAFVFLRPHLGGAKPAAAPMTIEIERTTVDLDEFTVNLADSDRARYVKMTIALEVGGGEKIAEEFKQKMLPRVRDAIIMTTSRQYYSELSTAQGKESLKRQLIAAVNTAVSGNQNGPVAEVLFTSLVMQ